MRPLWTPSFRDLVDVCFLVICTIIDSSDILTHLFFKKNKKVLFYIEVNVMKMATAISIY